MKTLRLLVLIFCFSSIGNLVNANEIDEKENGRFLHKELTCKVLMENLTSQIIATNQFFVDPQQPRSRKYYSISGIIDDRNISYRSYILAMPNPNQFHLSFNVLELLKDQYGNNKAEHLIRASFEPNLTNIDEVSPTTIFKWAGTVKSESVKIIISCVKN